VQDFYATVLERENDGRLLSQGPLPEEIREARLGFYADVAEEPWKGARVLDTASHQSPMRGDLVV
jgi:hypothetical protein